jgi:AcrR family transcriptional regulator
VNERSYRRDSPKRADRPSTDTPDTRTRIRLAALQLFLEQGYHGTSMRQIARRAGVAPAAIYNYLPSKEALFVDLLTERVPQRAMFSAMAEAQGASVEALVQDATQRVASRLTQEQDSLRLVFIELLEFQGRHVKSLAEERFPAAASFMARLQQADGRLRGFPPMIVARAYFGLVMSYAVSAAFFRDTGLVEVRQKDLTDFGDILLHGILEPAPAGPR